MFASFRLASTLLLGTCTCLVAPTAIASPAKKPDAPSSFDDVPDRHLAEYSRIINGDTTDPLEYPYFVKTYGCGGVLIASEWVLTAAHCGNQTGQKMHIASYQLGGGYRSICAEYIPHPEYYQYPNSGFSKNDVALCKLENPVYVDDSKVTLRLNDDPAFPNEESLVTIGFGVEHPFATSYAMFLQKAASVAISIEQCKDLFEQVENANETLSAIMDETFEDEGHICTVYDGLDYSGPHIGPCYGDSGGPLVSEQMVPGGKSVHTHVGIVSFGPVLCDRPPAVYARTSHGIGFVKQTICGDFGSPSPFCHEPVVCDDSSEAKLDIQVVSGDHPASVSWTLSKVGAGASGGPLLSGNNYTKPDFTYGDSICLEKGAAYQLLIEENTRDPFYTNLFSLALNGKEIARGVHFGLQEVVDIYVEDPGTPSCDDDPTYKFKKKSNGKTCSKIASLPKKKRRNMCNKKDPENGDGLVSDFCPSTCIKKCRKKKAKESTE